MKIITCMMAALFVLNYEEWNISIGLAINNPIVFIIIVLSLLGIDYIEVPKFRKKQKIAVKKKLEPSPFDVAFQEYMKSIPIRY